MEKIETVSGKWEDGVYYVCPFCGKKYRIVHLDYPRSKVKIRHRLEEIKGTTLDEF